MYQISIKSIMPPSMSDYLKKMAFDSSSAKLESSISNQKALILDFLKDKKILKLFQSELMMVTQALTFPGRPAFQAMLEDYPAWNCRCVVVKRHHDLEGNILIPGSIESYSRLLVCVYCHQ